MQNGEHGRGRRAQDDSTFAISPSELEKQELEARTKDFAVRIVQVVDMLPKVWTADEIGRQLLRAGTAVGASYRTASHARSHADFISKMGIVEEEANLSLFWMELLIEAELMHRLRLQDLMQEAEEILSIARSTVGPEVSDRSPSKRVTSTERPKTTPTRGARKTKRKTASVRL